MVQFGLVQKRILQFPGFTVVGGQPGDRKRKWDCQVKNGLADDPLG